MDVLPSRPKGPISLAETSPRLPRLISCGNSGDSGDQKMACALTKERRLGRPNTCMACALTSRRRLRDLLETEKISQKIGHVWISRDSPETRLVSRRRRGDVSATSGDSSLQASEIGPLAVFTHGMCARHTSSLYRARQRMAWSLPGIKSPLGAQCIPECCFKLRSDMAFASGEVDLFQAVTMPTFVLHGINPSPPGVTIHVWMLLSEYNNK